MFDVHYVKSPSYFYQKKMVGNGTMLKLALGLEELRLEELLLGEEELKEMGLNRHNMAKLQRASKLE